MKTLSPALEFKPMDGGVIQKRHCSTIATSLKSRTRRKVPPDWRRISTEFSRISRPGSWELTTASIQSTYRFIWTSLSSGSIGGRFRWRRSRRYWASVLPKVTNLCANYAIRRQPDKHFRPIHCFLTKEELRLDVDRY